MWTKLCSSSTVSVYNCFNTFIVSEPTSRNNICKTLCKYSALWRGSAIYLHNRKRFTAINMCRFRRSNAIAVFMYRHKWQLYNWNCVIRRKTILSVFQPRRDYGWKRQNKLLHLTRKCILTDRCVVIDTFVTPFSSEILIFKRHVTVFNAHLSSVHEAHILWRCSLKFFIQHCVRCWLYRFLSLNAKLFAIMKRSHS
jgi:hypothetical protein